MYILHIIIAASEDFGELGDRDDENHGTDETGPSKKAKLGQGNKAALKQNVYEWLEVDCRKYCNFSELLDNKDWKESRSIVKIHHWVLDTTRK